MLMPAPAMLVRSLMSVTCNFPRAVIPRREGVARDLPYAVGTEIRRDDMEAKQRYI
jgi:hypothetical protein